MPLARLLPFVLATAALPAAAHISYSGRDFGTLAATSRLTIANQAVGGNHGWADATDADFGDSHRARAFRFHLDDTLTIEITAAANAGATTTSVGGLLPGFSLYEGLAHVAPASADHDGAAITLAYLATLPGVPKEGAWVATGDWRIGNDGNAAQPAALSSFRFVGYAVDGTAANFGAAAGLLGDGTADGTVSGRFTLGPGDYSIFVGGADLAAQTDTTLPSYGLALTVSAVPEPATTALLAAGLAAVGWTARRRARHA